MTLFDEMTKNGTELPDAIVLEFPGEGSLVITGPEFMMRAACQAYEQLEGER